MFYSHRVLDETLKQHLCSHFSLDSFRHLPHSRNNARRRILEKPQQVAVIGELAFTLPTIGTVSQLFHQLANTVHTESIYDLCSYGVIIGMLGSMESLMSSSALENLSEIRVDSNKELIGQGLGNIAASLLGSISSAGSIIRSHANIKAGGRGRLSGVLCSVIMLLCIWTSAPLIGRIPLSIFAGVIISVGLTLFDLSILRFVKFYHPLFGIQKDIFISFIVHVSVVVITVTISLTLVMAKSTPSSNFWISKPIQKEMRS
jgi:MFS superfamily sulfate permease-like transporter